MGRQHVKSKICFIFAAIFIIYVVQSVRGHGHDHGHSHDQPASFKYSKQANEHPPPAAHHHDHDHHGHAHSHGSPHHGHSHDSHSHSHHGHSHDDHHGHSHDSHSHGHSHSDHHHGHSHDSHAETLKKMSSESKPARDTGLKLWFQALTATAIISVSPVFILLFIPLDNTDKHQPLLKVLLSFASGGLLGDAFLHLIPHAVSPHSHGGDDHGHTHSHDHGHFHGEEGHSHDMSVGLWVLAGIVAFLMVEKFVRIVKGGHGHSHGPVQKESKAGKSDEKEQKSDEKEEKSKEKEKVEKKTEKKTDKKTDEQTEECGKYL